MLKDECELKKIKLGEDGITIGTAETFQGQEKPIIIITTVRNNENLGFVKDERVSYSYSIFFKRKVFFIEFLYFYLFFRD